MKKLFIFSAIIFFGLYAIKTAPVDAQDGLVWTHKTGGMISSSPAVFGERVYYGSDDAYLYCRNTLTGETVWSHKADTSVLSTPVISKGILFFESGNILYALNADSGVEIWKFDPGSDTLVYKIDPWDYHHSSPVVDDTVVYYGCGNGTLYGVKIATGDASLQYQTVHRSAIRSTPLIKDGILYFGDWQSRIYALDILEQDTLWTFLTVIPEPDNNFGSIVTDIIEYNNSLYFGARNNTMRAVDITTGQDIWSFYDPTGSWIWGDPVIDDSIVYIGGSDNHQLWAVNANTGDIIWRYTAEQNIKGKPVLFDDFIVISSGLGGTFTVPNPYTNGYIHLVNRTTGSLENRFMVDGNIFTSTAYNDGIFYFGSNDSTLYAIDSAYLFRSVPRINLKDISSISLGRITEDTVFYVSIINSGVIADTLGITITSPVVLPEGTFEPDGEYLIIPPEQSDSLQVTLHPQGLEQGSYRLRIDVTSKELNWLHLTKSIYFSVPENTAVDETDAVKIVLFPNPANDFLSISGFEECIGIEIYNTYGRLILKEPIIGVKQKLNIGMLKQGIYTVKLITRSGEEVKQLIVL